MKKQLKMVLFVLLAAAVLWVPVTVSAADWPDRGITLVVLWGGGGVTDVAARMFAPLFEKYLEVPVVILNRPGASGVIGTEYASARPVDGYTVIFSAETPAFFCFRGSAAHFRMVRPAGRHPPHRGSYRPLRLLRGA